MKRLPGAIRRTIGANGFRALTRAVEPRVPTPLGDGGLAAFVIGRWTAAAPRAIRPVALLFRRGPAAAASHARRDADALRIQPSLAANVNLHLAWTHSTHQTAAFHTVLMQPQIATTVFTPPADMRLPATVHGASTNTFFGRGTDGLSLSRLVREGSASGTAAGGGPGHQSGAGSFVSRFIAVPQLLLMAAAPSVRWSRGQLLVSAERQSPVTMHHIRVGTPSPALLDTQRWRPAETIPVRAPHAPSLVIRSVGRRVLPRPNVIGSPARIVGWYRTSVERVAAPAVAMTMSERPPVALSSGERDGTRRHEAATIEYAKPDAALARTVSDAVRGVADVLRRETKLVAPPQPSQQIDVGRLTRQVYDQLERELRIEKERRGL